MQPEDAVFFCVFEERGGDEAEALGEAFAVAVGGEHAEDPPRRREGEGGEEQQAVDGENFRAPPSSIQDIGFGGEGG